MKQDQIYEELKNLAEKLGISVSEQSFKNIGIKVQSGPCKVKGQNIFVIDKHKSVRKKNIILGSYLTDMDYENIYLVPTVREFLKDKRSEQYGAYPRDQARRVDQTRKKS